MVHDYSKLKGRIVEKFGNFSNFAKALNTSSATVSSKLHDRISITIPDILEWSKLLEIALEDVGIYFFAFEV